MVSFVRAELPPSPAKPRRVGRRGSGDLTGALTDLGYILMAVWPSLRVLYRAWAGRRYAHLARGYAAWTAHRPEYLAALRAVVSRLPPTPGLIVDVGAGTGAATAVLAQAFPASPLVAVDAAPAMLAAWRPSSPRVHRVVGDAAALPVADGSAGLVIAHNAPFHIAEMRRVAGPDAAIAVVLGSAGRLPRMLRRSLARHLAASGWGPVEEYRADDGIGLLLRRTSATASTGYSGQTSGMTTRATPPSRSASGSPTLT